HGYGVVPHAADPYRARVDPGHHRRGARGRALRLVEAPRHLDPALPHPRRRRAARRFEPDQVHGGARATRPRPHGGVGDAVVPERAFDGSGRDVRCARPRRRAGAIWVSAPGEPGSVDGPREWVLSAAQRGNPSTPIDAGREPAAWTVRNRVEPLLHGADYFARLAMCIAATRDGDQLLVSDWRGDEDQL